MSTSVTATVAVLAVLAVAAVISVLGATAGAVAFGRVGPARLRRWARRGTHAFRAANRANIELQERYLRAQRPWQADWLRWTRTADGWQLSGTVLPPEPRHGRNAVPRRRPDSDIGTITI